MLHCKPSIPQPSAEPPLNASLPSHANILPALPAMWPSCQRTERQSIFHLQKPHLQPAYTECHLKLAVMCFIRNIKNLVWIQACRFEANVVWDQRNPGCACVHYYPSKLHLMLSYTPLHPSSPCSSTLSQCSLLYPSQSVQFVLFFPLSSKGASLHRNNGSEAAAICRSW